jgi:hypothetical protein
MRISSESSTASVSDSLGQVRQLALTPPLFAVVSTDARLRRRSASSSAKLTQLHPSA